ncbi:hypothetical protein KEM60_00449 [Austwickia sp. TVS 96-490-7B]|uniref:5'-nucleotidase n=1 Tax=Austwickia sp. TVS 96-490-7B TaxID=2830843 RepID=UPI001C59ED2C|nr:5'-nucleotidase [Austwickia sp. TVS 96-490-7B]MBW3084262.1 hypothetical protein [Austwickia sp. TVS 96-490-7B]
MSYDLTGRLVIGVASSALFDLTESGRVFREHGEAAYRDYQEEHRDDPLRPGVAFPFIRRLLALNDLMPPDDPLVEVIILSRNNPETGLRVMRSVASHGLAISRAVFTQGRAPFVFMPAFAMSLFLSADEDDVRRAVAAGLPAGRVLESAMVDDPDDQEVRVAFDFDGVLADDQSERIFQGSGLPSFHEYETSHAELPHAPGPLQDFLTNLNRIQQVEENRRREDPSYRLRVQVSLITARNAPSHERAVRSLKAWGVQVNEAFFLGGVDKGTVTSILRPHLFFDDQVSHLQSTSRFAPSVHVPFGVTNGSSESDEPDPTGVSPHL